MTNFIWKTLRKRLSCSRPSKPSRRRQRLELEQLEDRIVPTPLLMVGPNVNITKVTGNQAESTISINPTNPSNLFEDDTLSTVGHYSTNGGATWKVSNMSALPASDGDVLTTWDSFGNLFLTEFGTNDDSIVARSSDGGATFKDVRTVMSASSDQPKIAFGPSGVAGIPEAVWVSVNDATSNAIVAAAAPVMGFDSVGAFSAPVTLPGSNPGDFGSIAVGPNGQVMANYQSNLVNSSGINPGPDNLRANLDPDGLGPAPFGNSFTITSTNVGGFSPIPAQPNRDIDAEGKLAWDRSGGPHNGRLYFVYVDRSSTSSPSTQIYVRYSDNNGATWSSPVRVNDDPIGNGKSHFQPYIAVDQTTGNVAVTWYDTRNSGPANTTTQVFGSVSLDGGVTWLPNVQISTGTSDASAVDGSFDYGDYDAMDFSHNFIYRTWADNSDSTGDNPDGTSALDIYTARVTLQPIIFNLTNTVEGHPLTNVPVATFRDNSAAPLSSYTAAINWGDGTSSSASGSNGTIVAGSSLDTFVIFSSHTYINAGNYTLTVTVNNGTATIGPVSGTVVVADAPLQGFAQALNAATAGFVNNALVAVFTDTDPTLRSPSHYTAAITWNEGNGLAFSSTGTISHLFANTFSVYGSSPYTFPSGGLFTVQVVIHDVGGGSVAVNSVVSVSHNPAIPPLVPQYQADTSPFTAQFVSLQDTLTNLLNAERLFMLAVGFGTTREKQGTFGNLVNALLAYEAAILNFDMHLPGS